MFHQHYFWRHCRRTVSVTTTKSRNSIVSSILVSQFPTLHLLASCYIGMFHYPASRRDFHLSGGLRSAERTEYGPTHSHMCFRCMLLRRICYLESARSYNSKTRASCEPSVIGFNTQNDLEIYSHFFSADLKAFKSAIMMFLVLMSLSPVLRTLTAATSSDSIWALASILFGLNALLADYTATKTKDTHEG